MPRDAVDLGCLFALAHLTGLPDRPITFLMRGARLAPEQIRGGPTDQLSRRPAEQGFVVAIHK